MNWLQEKYWIIFDDDPHQATSVKSRADAMVEWVMTECKGNQDAVSYNKDNINYLAKNDAALSSFHL